MKKIMFNDRYGLTQAVLNGSKTMTRRIVPQQILKKVEEYQEEYYNGALETISEKDAILSIATYEYHHRFPQVGEVVAIAQSYYVCGVCLFPKIKDENGNYEQGDAGDYNKMFVKADLMPHHIRITNVRVERLQDISEEDCLREGVRLRSEPSKYQEVWSPEYTFGNGKYHAKYPRAAFAALIDCISGKGTWERNPYVFVYEFELVD